jgi:hypothetical protein
MMDAEIWKFKSAVPAYVAVGEGCLVLLDILEYEKQQAVIKLLSKLSEAEDVTKNGDECKIRLCKMVQ